MLSIIIGNLLLILGFFIVVLPVLITELSRPRDSAWGALVMILGLILITSYERFNGSPMLAVLLGSFIFSRLFVEVSQNRWQQLTNEEKSDLKTFSRFKNSFIQIFSAFGKLYSIFLDGFKLFKPKPKPSSIGKKWTRPEFKNEIQSLESKQPSSRQDSIKEEDLVHEKILKSTSGNNTSNAS